VIAASYGGWRPGLRRSFSGTTLALAIGMHRLLTLVTPTVVVLGLCSPGCVVGPDDGAGPGPGEGLDAGDPPLILPELAHGGYDGVHAFQLPMATSLRGEVQWQVDGTAADVVPTTIPGDAVGSPLSTWVVLTVGRSGSVVVTASSAAQEMSAVLEITSYTPAEIALGERRYRQPGDALAPGRVSCASCHERPEGHDHSALLTMYWADDQLLSAITTGRYDDTTSLAVPHAWDIRPDEERAIVGFLRSLPPGGF
jgi:hypothetical protein